MVVVYSIRTFPVSFISGEVQGEKEAKKGVLWAFHATAPLFSHNSPIHDQRNLVIFV
jgi:hypothetical protein